MYKEKLRNKFKKKFISKEELLELFPTIERRIQTLKESYESKKIQDYEFCASYILEFYKTLYPKHWHMGVSLLPYYSSYEDLNALFKYNIRALPLAVRDSLGKWSEQSYPIRLYFDVPTSFEVLQMQTEGYRCVTAITGERLKYYVADERDPLSFLIHDLLHAHHFWSDSDNAMAQIEIYKWFYALLQEGLLTELLEDELFKKGFEYVSSDMNTHPLHLLKTFKFHIDDYFTRNNLKNKNQFFDQLHKTKKGKLISEFSLLNTSLETKEVVDRLLLLF